MDLLNYLNRSRRKRGEFAAAIGMSIDGLADAIRREWFNRRALERIIQETDGQVTPNDFFDIPAILAAKPKRQESADEAA